MKVFTPRVSAKAATFLLAALTSLLFTVVAFGQSQVATADLSGTVTDPDGAVVAGATVTARNSSTGISRTVTSNADGSYQIISLPPGEYEVIATAANFKKSVLSGIKLTVGQNAELTVKLEIGETSVVVNVSGDDVQLVETTKTNVSNTIEQVRIENLPINQRDATGFALTLSTVGRDNGRPIGPAPTSGLNIGGQRGRSTQVNVDGSDFTDNSINAARSTVSQEAVQEYQVTTNSYMPEFGRATGGIVNVVTKRGGSDFHGNVFGFIRHKTIQARNAFAPIIDGDPNKKPGFTRTQYGATLGGPLNPGKTFFFAAFEQRRRQESGFFTSDVNKGATSSITIGAPFLPASQTFTNLRPDQVNYIQSALASGDMTRIQYAVAYAHIASAGGQTALNGTSTLVNYLPGLPVPQLSVIGSRFLLSGAPIPLTRRSDGQLVAFRPLAQLPKVFPIAESSTYFSIRGDHTFSESNQLSLRLNFSPITQNGIQDESQNQTLGQNDYSRTGIMEIEDFSFGAGLTTVMSNNMVNDFNYSFGRRAQKFDSQVPSVALQIPGVAFSGSNPFSPINRLEQSHQIRDNITWVRGNHTFKFGGELQRVKVKARFDLNFPAIFNFGQTSGGTLVSLAGVACDSATIALANRCPAFSAVQSYGLGFPSVFLQGFGNPNSELVNKPIAMFVQDSWRLTRRFTVNFGVRYDYEFTQQFPTTAFRDPLTGITLSAQDVLTAQDAIGITQGIPRDKNNFAPRLGFAWDVAGNGRTVIRGAAGVYYDHPLLTLSFNSNVADGSQQQQATLLPFGSPSPLSLLNPSQVFHGTVVNCNFVGAIPGTNCTPGLAGSAQYLNGLMRFNPATFTGFGPVLPFTLHLAKNFEYPMSLQGNIAIEKMIGKDMSLSATLITQNARHLNHPQDINSPNTDFLRENFRRFAVNNPAFPGCTSATPNAASCFPTSITAASFFYLGAAQAALATTNALYTTLTPGTPIGLVNINNTTGQRFVNPIAANYFRPLGPNYFFPAAISGGLVTKAAFDAALAGTVRTPGPISSFGDISAQLSDGNSYYNAMNLELKKRFSNSMQFLASYTWSHSIDDSSDLQTLLKPLNNRNFRAEKSDSLFDQRHRFVFNAILGAPDDWKSAGGFRGFLHGFTFAPIVELGSGRPFNIIAPGDSNGDFQSSNERPSVRSDGTLCQTGVDLNCLVGVFPADGSLGRNMGITHSFFSVDARLSRKVNLGERMRLDIIAEGFNLFNRFNEGSANPLYTDVNAFGKRAGNGRYYSSPTAAFDPRQFQFGLKLSF